MAENLRIAMIGLRGIPAKSGGVEMVVDHLSTRLAGLGAQVTVYCRNPYCAEKPAMYNGVKLRYLGTINTKHTEAIIHTLLASLDAMFSDYDIVHYHALGNSIFSFMPRITGKKTIVTLHGLDYEREKWGRAAKLYLRLCEQLSLLFPNRITAVSSRIKEHFSQKHKKDIDFIRNGVEQEKFQPISGLKRFGLEKGKYILFLSRIVPEKGLHYLIDAFRETKTNMKLVIAGDSSHTDKYFETIRDSAAHDKRIIFTGPLYDNDKKEAYSNARFFVLPSTMEGMPIVLLEAMSFGLCPLVSDINENLEVIENGSYGVSFMSKDTKELRDKLNYMINNPDKIKKKGELCKTYVEKKFSWDEISKSYLELYKEVMKSG